MERDEICLTDLEEKVEDFLDRRGIKHISQFPLRLGFIADFAILDKKIIIEVDGKKWHSGKKKLQKDRFKDYMLRRDGWKVIRIKEEEIDDLDIVLAPLLSSFSIPDKEY